jgi:peptide/nickel transport system substrate-binding protein
MGVTRPFQFLLVLLVLALAACAPARPEASTTASPGQEARQGGPKRFTAAIRGDPHTVYQKLNPRSNIPGIDDLERLVNAGLTVQDLDGNLQPRLAEAVPNIENGLWRVFPDGRMETTWHIRDGARWQDGELLTADDLVFTAQAWRDPELPVLGHIAFSSVDTVEAIDVRTVTVRWKKPYIDADVMFGLSQPNGYGTPIPKHLLETAYGEDKEHFIEHPYWSTDFVGLGPFKLKEWERGSHLVLEANDRYLLGRPKIDEIRVKFIPDPNTLAANILAGEVDLTMGGRISTEWAMNVRDLWREGTLVMVYRSMLQTYPQFINPSPPIIADLQFRRAMVYALDRQQMVDTLQFGLTSIGHTFVSPREREFAEIDGSIVKYEYDPRRASQMIELLGYSKGPDGFFRDRSGQTLQVQARTSQGDDLQEKTMYAAADDWQKVGVQVERHLVPPQRANDAEYRATFPAFDVKRQAGTMDYARNFHSDRVALPENSYLASGNNSRYRNRELDASIERYFTTIPHEDRMDAARRIVQHVSEQVAWIGLFYQTEPDLMANRLLNVSVPKSSGSSRLWNIHEWDIR